MIDGIYQSVLVFYVPYLAFQATFVSHNGLDVQDLLRLGAYIVHPAIITINLYILINTYRWDWLMLAIVAFSDLFVFCWTGIYTQFLPAGHMFKAAGQVYQQGSFWAIFFIVPVMCLFPRFAIKSLQKVYYPYDVDIIREQVILGKFDYLEPPEMSHKNKVKKDKRDKERREREAKEAATASKVDFFTPNSPAMYGKAKHVGYGSVDEEQRPIYPASVVTTTTAPHHIRSQTGSDSTNFTTERRSSLDDALAEPVRSRQSIERARPSYDRIRASMDRVRPSFEASSDFTSAARLSLVESSHGRLSTHNGRFRPRLRGLSLHKNSPHHRDNHSQDDKDKH
ncbi:hypothetical protein IMZ48_18605 [Candidatus Bathyarchaeota archaeon]|nr:hypothetical protein [Candidatus Bathyarchaeota archaeon]